MSDPAAITALTGAPRATYDTLFVESLRPVFHMASLLAFLAFLLAFAIKEVPLKTSLTSEAPGDPFQMPRDATSLEELGRIVSRVTARENRWRVYQQSAERLGIKLEPDEYWLLARIGEAGGRAARTDLIARMGPKDERQPKMFSRLRDAGMARKVDDETVELTPEGRAVYDRLVRQREDDLKKMLADWNSNEHPDVMAMMRELAKSFASSPPVKPRVERAAAATSSIADWARRSRHPKG